MNTSNLECKTNFIQHFFDIMHTQISRKHPLYAILCTSLVLLSCNNSPIVSQAEMERITRESNAQLKQYFIAGDAEKLAEMYDENAQLCPNGDDFCTGKKAIAEAWKKNLAESKVQAMQTNTLVVRGNADEIYETGTTYTETLYKDSVYKSTVKYVNVWKRQSDNSWKLVIDFWNDVKKR